MRPLTIGIFILTIFCASTTALGDAQFPDKLRYEGKEYALFSTPLEPLYTGDATQRPHFMSGPNAGSSALERQYVATWEITGNKLYLVSIDSWFCWADTSPLSNNCRRAGIEDVVGDTVNDSTRFASWFTGTLRVPLGKELFYIHSGFERIYERDMMFEVKAGVVGSPCMRDNTKKPLPPPEYGWSYMPLPLLAATEIASDEPLVDALAGYREPIIPATGSGKIGLGATREQIEAILGKGDRVNLQRYKARLTYFDYPGSGVQVGYGPANAAEVIYFYVRPRRAQGVRNLKTREGVTWNSSPEDVLKTYGTPVTDHNSTEFHYGKDWRIITFGGIDFRFESNQLVRIGIMP